MKRGRMFGIKWLFVAGLVSILSLMYGCQEESQPDEGTEISLHFVPKDAGYMRLPMIGTHWKLVGFADGKTNKIKWATPYRDKSYTLHFKKKGELEGFTSSNVVWSTYSFHPAIENGLDLSSFGPSTYAGESEEGYLYIELMKKVNSFRISTRGLELYYDPRQYLLFQPME